jgi:hypothetical protein
MPKTIPNTAKTFKPERRISAMQTTLYRTATPEKFVSEYYEIAVLARPGATPSDYMFVEMHGWWDEGERRPVNNITTICPEEGMTFEEAKKMYETQVEHRARSGFIYSFTQNPFGNGPSVIRL